MRIEGRYIKMDKAVVVIVSALLALTNCHTAAFAGDLPAGAVVQAGNASITSDGTNMTVVTDAAKTWIDWTGGFNIGAANSVNNIAAETSAVILHRDITGALSNIQGTLTANCNVFLLNPSGILFGSGAQINVAGLLVSTLNMSIQDFINGDYLLEQGVADAGLITNLGEINATGPMGVTLAGGAVRNEGVINAGLGTVNLVSGSKVTLNADNEGLIRVAVDGKVLENVYDKDGNKVEFGVDNVGEINANGGKVYIETEAAQNVFSKLINQSGVVKAGSMVNKGGKIVLVSNSEGIIQNTGILDAGAVESGARGGTIEIRGEKVGQFGTVKADGLGAGGGGNVELRAAKTVALGTHSATTANAGVNGNGGRVVVFSPDSALMAPTAQIAVRGGDNSGDGGFVEFSGQKYVEVNGIIDRSAPRGKAGLLLIDPTDITINDAGVDDTLWTGDNWADDSARATSQIDIDTLIGHLANGDTIITTVSGSVASAGNITLNAPGKALTNTTAHSLTLTAENNITLDTAVHFSGSGSLNLNATGTVTLNNSVALNGGTFDSNGTSFTSGALGTITTNGGAVDLSGHSAGITIGAAINTRGGSFISAGTTFDNTGGTITTAGGDITINQTGVVTIGAALDSGTGNVNIDAGDTLAINKPIIATTGNISIDSTNATTIAAGADIQTGSGSVIFGADKTGALTTSADIIAGGSITFTRGVTLGAASVITSLNDSVTFSGDVSGAFSLSVNAAEAAFSSTIGNSDDPTSLIITANKTSFGGAVSVGSLTINGSGGTTTISADITSAGAIEINDNVVISGVRTISTAAANADIYISGTVNATLPNTDSLTLAAGSGDVTLGNSVGDSVQLEDLTITSSGTTTLNHTIDVNGSDVGEDIDLSQATNVVLGSDVTLDSARSVLLNAVNGQGHDLTVRAEYTIDLNADISNVLNASMTAVRNTMLLDHAVTAIEDATFTTINGGADITVQAALTAGHSLTLTANTASTLSDIEIGAGSDLEAPAVTVRSSIIRIYRPVDNSIGSLHLIAEHTSGGMVLRNSITAHGDLTIDGSIWVNSDGVGLTSTDGDIRLNCTVDSNDATSRDLSLTAGQGTVYAGTFGGTFRLEDISVSAQQLVLGGNIAAETVNTSSVGLTTLANAIDIDTTVGAGSITLGPLTGANNLTISAGGAVTLNDADIASLDIDAATTVGFNGDFVTSGGVTVDTAITGDITVSGSIQAGGNVSLDNTAGAGTADIVLNGNVSTTGSSTIAISADDAVNIAQSAAASVSAVNGEIDITSPGAIALGTGTYVGKITTTGAGAIDINNTGTLTMGTASGTEISGGGDVDIAGAAGITNTIASTTSGDVALHGAVTLAANAVVSSANGNVTFYNTVNATSDNTETLTANALNGIVTFQNTIGDTTDPGALTVNASTAVFYNTVLAGGNIDINANAVTLDTVNSGTFQTTANNGYIDFGTALIDSAGEAVAFAVTADGSGNVVLGTIGSSDPVSSVSVTTTSGSTTLNGDITADGAAGIDLSSAGNVLLNNNVTLTTTNSDGDVVLDSVNGSKTLTVNSADDITINDDIGGSTALTAVTLYAADVITTGAGGTINAVGTVSIRTGLSSGDDITIGATIGAASVTISGDEVNINAGITGTDSVNITANGSTSGDDVNLAASVSSAAATITANNNGIINVTVTQDNTLGSTTYEGAVTLDGTVADSITLTSLGDMTFNGAVTATDIGSGGITSTNGSLYFNADLSGADTINLNAKNGIYLNTVGAGDDPTLLDLNSATAQLSGAINAVAIDTTGVGTTTLAADITITATGSGNVIQLGDLIGQKDLTLDADGSASDVILNGANIGSLIINDADDVTFNGSFVTSGAVTVDTAVTGNITVASTGSIQAGGNVTLDNTAGAGTADIILDGDVSAKGSGVVTINADDAVNIAQNAAASVTAVNGAIDINAAGAVLIGTASYAGKVVTEGSGNISIDAGTNSDITITGTNSQVSAGGDVNIGQTVSSANVNVNSNSKIQAAGDITVDGDIITIQSTGNVISTAGDIDLESTVGALNLEGNITAVGNTVTLTSAAGISDTSDGDTDITARILSITAASGIGSGAGTNALDTDVDYISASVSGTGDIYILEESGVTLSDISTNNGLINITSGSVATGNTIVTSVVAGGTANVDITATRGDIYLATVTAAGDTATITATAGSVYDDTVNTTKVSATSVSLTAAGSIGASSTDADIDTACTDLTAATTAGDIYITDDDAVNLSNVTTGTGSITIKGARSAAGDMTVTLVTAGTAGGSGDGDVTLETLDGGGSTNDIILAGPVTASNDSVTLISDFDISDSYTTAADIVAGALYLQAGGSFGASGDYIDTNVSTIDDVASGKNVAGSIYIREYDDVELGSVNGLTTVSGDIRVEAGVSVSGALTAAKVTAGGSGDIYLTTYNTSDIALGYVNALGDDVTLISANNITDEDTDSDIDVVADHLYLQAAGYCGTTGTGAAIDTDVAYIDNVAANVVAGSIYINENDGVTLGAANGLTSTNGPIYITAANNADGTLTASAVTVATDNSNGITLITNRGNGGLNNIQLGAVTAGTASAVITLSSDNDILDGAGAVDITAYGLLLEAGGSVGTFGDYVDTAVSTIDDRSASANVHNSIYINESDVVTLGAVNGLSTDNGDIHVTAAGTLTASSVTAGDAGDIYLTTSSGDIAVGLITALDDDVYLNAAGSITDGDSGVDIYAGRLYLTAGADVGATDDYIDTRVNNIDDYSATENVAGNIYIKEYDGVNLGALTSTGLSTDNGSVFVESNATEDGTLTATLVTAGGSGDISLKSQAGAASTGNVNDIAVGLLTASGDDVILNSNDDIIDLTYDEVTDIVASGLYLAAGGTVGGDGSGLELDTRVSTIDDISGSNVYESIYIIEYDGVSLGSVNGLTTDTGDIDITSAKTAAGDMDAVSVTAGGTGNILLTTLDGGSASNNINVGLVTAADDDVSLVSDGDITDADTTGLDVAAASLHLQSGGAVGAAANYLDTRVANIDDYSGGNVGTDLYISEYDGVILGALNTSTGLSTANGEIKVTAAVTAAGDLTAQKLTAGGTGKDIYLTTEDGGSGSNNIGLGVVTASGDDIYLNSDWNITDSDLDLTADLVSSGLYFTALGSFGGSGDPARIETTVDTIDDYALGVNVSGSIYISETDAVTLGSIFGLTTDAGVIDIVIGNNTVTGTLAANGGFGIFLNSTGGDLLDLANGSFTATAKSELRAGGIIGTIENPYDVNITSGGLWVWAGSQNREVSANLRGTVVSNADTERVEIFEPSPPGLVIFDNHLMGGGNYGSGSANGSILSRGYGYIDVIRNDFIDSVYARALQQPWGYKLLLAWAFAEGPKIDEKFMSDVPTTIDAGLLNLPVLYTDMQKPMDYYVIRSIR